MKNLSDDELRRRLQELGRHEAGTAPPLHRVIQVRPAPQPAFAWPAPFLRGAFALAGALALVVALSWRGPTQPKGEGPLASPTALADPLEDWDLPSDGLLIEVPFPSREPGASGDGRADGEVDRLSREIEGLLQP